MNIAFCYESVLPARGGCETYISDLARRLIADRHEVHLIRLPLGRDALPDACTITAAERSSARVFSGPGGSPSNA